MTLTTLCLRWCAGTVALLACCAMAMLPGAAIGQIQRDPTLPPSVPVAGGASDQAAAPAPMAVIVRDGRPYVVAGTRLVAQGQMLGGARVERISETEIWLREGKALRKIPACARPQHPETLRNCLAAHNPHAWRRSCPTK